MKFSRTLSLALGAAGLVDAGCQANNCLRAVTGGRADASSSHRADCSSFMAATVTPATVTSTITKTVTPFTTTLVVHSTATVPPAAKRRQVTVSPSSVPSYASACAGPSEYSSACSCWGITRSTSTATAPTYYTTTTVSCTATLTTTAIETPPTPTCSAVSVSVTETTTKTITETTTETNTETTTETTTTTLTGTPTTPTCSTTVTATTTVTTACATPSTICASDCTDLRTDPNNCGACGNACASGKCSNGFCINCAVGSGCNSNMCGPTSSCICLTTPESGTEGICIQAPAPCSAPSCTASTDCGPGEICDSNNCCGKGLCTAVTYCDNSVLPSRIFRARAMAGTGDDRPSHIWPALGS